jgi:integrase
MRLHKKGKKDPNYNYLNVNRYGVPSSFQFFRSKSQGYEDTTKRIPSSLKNIIMTSLREVKNNTLLFPRRDGEIHNADHNADSFSKKIRDLFGIITGKRISMNTYRHIVATHLSDKGYSMNKREETAQSMGHSLIRQMEYAKRD